MPQNAYAQIITSIFLDGYQEGAIEVLFTREDIAVHAERLHLPRPRNLGDVVYSFRYRANLPPEISDTAPDGMQWVIIGVGDAQYKFVLSRNTNISPNTNLLPINLLDNTPEIITRYSLSDEQSLLSRVRCNRILDVFLGIVSYSLQNHLRTKIPDIGQIEIDELYVGVNKIGQHFILPVQAKVGNDKIGVVQLMQDIAFCSSKFPDMICVPIAVHFLENENTICMFRLTLDDMSVRIVDEKHYKLINNSELSQDYVRRLSTENDPLTI